MNQGVMEITGQQIKPGKGGVTAQSDENFVKEQVQEEKCKFSKKCKILTLVGVVIVVALTVGLSVGLTLHLRPKVVEVEESNEIKFSNDQSVQFTKMKLKDVNLFEPNLEFTLIRSQPIITKGGRLLQEGPNPTEFTSTVNLEQQGISAQVQSSDSALSLVVDPVVLTDYIASVDPEVARLLQQFEKQMAANPQKAEDIKQVSEDLGKALSEELNDGSPVQQQVTAYVTLDINKQTGQLEYEQEPNKRLLQQTRILFLRRFVKRIANVVKKVVKPVVKAIRVAGPYIGAAVGAVGGFIVAGPAGAVAGGKLGYRIGSVAQSFVKACLPQNNLKIRCDPSAMVTEGANVLSAMGKPPTGSLMTKVTGFAKIAAALRK